MATSYANNGGTGERRPEIIVTSNIVSAGTDIGVGTAYTANDMGVLVDGITSTASTPGNGSNGREFGNGNNGIAKSIVFDFGVNATIVVDEFKLYLSGTTNFGTWTLDGSNNGSAWTTIGASFTLQASAGSLTIARTNSTAYRYYRLNTTSLSNGGGGSGVWTEVELKIEDTTPQASRCSWFNTGGKGDRTAFISTTGSTVTYTSGAVANLIDGSYTNNSSDAVVLTTGQTTGIWRWDFGAGNSVIIDTVLIWLASAAGASSGSWKLQGSPDASSWTDLDTTANLLDTGNAYKLQKRTVANTTAYRYYQLIQTSGTTSTPTILEIEFRIGGFAATLAKDYKLSGYGVVVPDRALDFKLSGYSVVAPVSAKDFKLSGYAIIKPVSASSSQPVLIVCVG